jgi:hypothetical protein
VRAPASPARACHTPGLHLLCGCWSYLPGARICSYWRRWPAEAFRFPYSSPVHKFWPSTAYLRRNCSHDAINTPIYTELLVAHQTTRPRLYVPAQTRSSPARSRRNAASGRVSNAPASSQRGRGIREAQL